MGDLCIGVAGGVEAVLPLKAKPLGHRRGDREHAETADDWGAARIVETPG